MYTKTPITNADIQLFLYTKTYITSADIWLVILISILFLKGESNN